MCGKHELKVAMECFLIDWYNKYRVSITVLIIKENIPLGRAEAYESLPLNVL